MLKNKAYKFRMYPNKNQIILLTKTFGCSRLVFNYYLNKKTKLYEEKKESLSTTECIKDLVNLKKEKDFLREVDSISLQQEIRHLDKAFKSFYKKIAAYPNFKSKRNHYYSYSTVNVNDNVKILNNRHIVLPKIGVVYAKIHREINDDYVLKSATVSKTPSGKYYVSFLFEYYEETKMKEIRNSIGLDYSQKNFFVSNDKELKTKQSELRYYERNQVKLAFLQMTLSKCKKGSNRYNKAKLKVARLHEHISNCRQDFLNKQSALIAKKYDLVSIESLDMIKMEQNKENKLSKRVVDNSWSKFVSMLEYKLSDIGGRLVKIDKYFPSSKMCNVCGNVNEHLKLGERYWTCQNCGTSHNRDKNASINIAKEGLRMVFNPK